VVGVDVGLAVGSGGKVGNEAGVAVGVGVYGTTILAPNVVSDGLYCELPIKLRVTVCNPIVKLFVGN
jgi:hypothetical protein